MRSKIRKCRKECNCTEHSWHLISKGDYYLNCVATPWHDMNDSGKYQEIKACLRCAREYGLLGSDTRKQLEELRAKP